MEVLADSAETPQQGKGLMGQTSYVIQGCLFWFLAAAVGPCPSKISAVMRLISTGAMFSPERQTRPRATSST